MDSATLELFRIYGRNVRTTRNRKQLTLQKLAQMSGYNREDLSTLESGEHDLYMNTSLNIAKALDIYYPALFSRSFVDFQGCDRVYTEENFIIIFNENAKRILKEKRRNQISLQAGSGIDSSTISHLFGLTTSNPKVSTLQRIAESLGSDVEAMMRRKCL